MLQNLYHVLGFLPATEKWEMPPMLEQLARAIVASGKLRIHADQERNFVRYGTANSDFTFTTRELTDPTLASATAHRVARLVAPAAGQQGLDDVHTHLLREMKKARGVSPQKEIRVARVLAQSAHPAVIQLLLNSGTEIFVSYSHNVAELMPVHAWEKNGTASGLQATETEGTAVYISAGGDPFFEGEQKTYVTDGFPALARMVVIAGQELGHFADLRRSAHGIIGRHSTAANNSQVRANPIAQQARLADIKNVARLTAAYHQCGLPRLRRAEKSVAFYHARLRYSPPWIFYQVVRFVHWSRFVLRCRRHNLLHRFAVLPHMRLGDAIANYLSDMAFNLEPEAEVYRNPDPQVEEAIQVIEAVARVPQQMHKWGPQGVTQAWPGLVGFYFGTVIPACQAALPIPLKVETIKPLQKLKVQLRRRLRPRPEYYP